MNLRLAAFVLVALVVTACEPADPMEQKLHAKSAIDFDIWKGRVVARLEPVQRRWFQHAMQELQLYAVSEWEGQGSAEQHAKLIAQLDNHTLREILIRGYELALDRRDVLLQDHRVFYHAHVDLLRRPHTTPEGASRVQATMEQIAEQLAELEAEQREDSEILDKLMLSSSPASRNP